MDVGPEKPTVQLSWMNVGLAFSFILFNATISKAVGLGVGTSLVTAAVRCIVQLTLVAMILQNVFETSNLWGVAGIALVNKAKLRYQHMFPSVLVSMLGSTIPVSIIGIRFAMSVEPFWTPDQYIPVVGMLCGSTISGVVVAAGYVLKELYENKDKVETYLAFGASRFEACKPIATDALRLALTPNINQMSVLGIIAIPGMMTGAILGGSSVEQAARLQMVIMFMISASTALASIVTTIFALSVVVDVDHRIRMDKIDRRPHAIWRGRDRLVKKTGESIQLGWRKAKVLFSKRDKYGDEIETIEIQGLLG